MLSSMTDTQLAGMSNVMLQGCNGHGRMLPINLDTIENLIIMKPVDSCHYFIVLWVSICVGVGLRICMKRADDA